MSLSLESGLTILKKGADSPQKTDSRLQARILDIQGIVGSELKDVELALAQAVTRGSKPATEAARHLVSLGGKRVRPTALLLSAACFGEIAPPARELAVVVELVHSATLLHDDVIDEGQQRRSALTARRIFGNAISVLAGDMLLVGALERTHEQAPQLLPDLIAVLKRLVDGEIIQLRGRTALDITESTYERILRDKTASLFGWATRAGARLGGAGPEQEAVLAAFGEDMGVAFQLVDDVLDYSTKNTGKSSLVDLAEGKLTLPLVLAVRAMPELLEPLKRIHQGDLEPVPFVSRKVIECGACQAVRERAKAITKQAVSQLEPLPDSPAKSLLSLIAVELTERAS